MATKKGDIQSLEFSLSEVDRGSGFARPRALLEFRCTLRGEQKEKRKTRWGWHRNGTGMQPNMHLREVGGGCVL